VHVTPWSFESVYMASLRPRWSKMSWILPIPTTSTAASTSRSSTVGLGGATAPQNREDEGGGGINKAYAWSKSSSDRFSGVVKQWKRRNPKAYRVLRPVLAVVVLTLLGYWLFG